MLAFASATLKATSLSVPPASSEAMINFIIHIIVALGLVNAGVAHDDARDIGMNVRRDQGDHKTSPRSLSLTSETGIADELETHGRRLPPKKTTTAATAKKGKGGKGGPCTSTTTYQSALTAINAECSALLGVTEVALVQAPSDVIEYCLLVEQITAITIPPPDESAAIPIGFPKPPSKKGKGKGA